MKVFMLSFFLIIASDNIYASRIYVLNRALLKPNLKAIIRKHINPRPTDVLYVSYYRSKGRCKVEKWEYVDYYGVLWYYDDIGKTYYDYIDRTLCLISPHNMRHVALKIPFNKKNISFEFRALPKDWNPPTYYFALKQ